MSAIAATKSHEDVHRAASERCDLRVVPDHSCCDPCRKTSKTGGTAVVRPLRAQLRVSGSMVREVPVIQAVCRRI
jgi:hypothetical protein